MTLKLNAGTMSKFVVRCTDFCTRKPSNSRLRHHLHIEAAPATTGRAQAQLI